MKRKDFWQAVVVGLFALIFVLMPLTPVRADGGPIVKDPEVWVQLEEDEQIAVVRLGEEDTVQVDLFVSLHDASGKPHEITFFIPLGSHPTAFEVVEESLRDFRAAQIDELDKRLRDAAQWEVDYRRDVRSSLLPGALLTSGIWASWAVWRVSARPVVEEIFGTIAGSLGGDESGDEVAPVATFQTEHSLIELYEIEADMNLEALIATTGLHPVVQETLRRLEGQQVAVITMQTLPAGRQGLRLAWTTQLVPGEKGGTYVYPLGTGSAWARPIKLTSVYVVAPPGVDLGVVYPRLGENRSGYVYDKGGFLVTDPAMHARRVADFWPRILLHTDTPGYAVDQAWGDSRVWRATYVQSNAAEDIRITRVDGLLLKTRLRLIVQQGARRYTWAAGLLAAVAIWVTLWRFVVSLWLGFPYRWRQVVGGALVYLVFNGIATGMYLMCLAFLLPIPYSSSDLVLELVGATLFGLLAGGASSFLFARSTAPKWDISIRRAAGAYGLIVVTANVAFGLLALAYLALVGAL